LITALPQAVSPEQNKDKNYTPFKNNYLSKTNKKNIENKRKKFELHNM